ncbi:hypothetical protein AGOR_G00057450 [Albula goreensis]|uniref:CLIP1 zinc knuckle domain-containing protein n=1 Tax=Albula goreensis TaxID=1534307 RepID=A0A8T3DW60_9TELE|nr:hypothetical protein AGOR_G00057450 [Albula goreensis]
MMRTSGDSSAQLTKMNDDLTEKERRLEELQGQLLEARERAERAEANEKQGCARAEQELQQSRDMHQEQLRTLQEQITQLEQSVEQAKARSQELQTAQEKTVQEEGERHSQQLQQLQDGLDKAKQELSCSRDRSKELEQLVAELQPYKEQAQAAQSASQMAQALEQLKQEKSEIQALLEGSRSAKQEVERQLEALKQQNSKYQEDLGVSKEQLTSETQRISSLSKEIEELKQTASQKFQDFTALQQENRKLAEELSNSRHDVSNQQKLEEECSTLNNQLLEMQMRESTLKKESDEEKTSLQKSIQKTSALIMERDKELETLRSEIAVLRGEKSAAQILQSAVQSLEADKARLQERVQSLERQLADEPAVSGASSPADAAVEHIKEEKESADGQIDFLNSVIVDLQRKNQELTGKLEKMAEAALNGNNASELDNYDGLKDAPSKKKPPPRLFCDICDCFDLHDTEDCPTQAQLPDSPPHTAYHGNRSDERPYCDICEVFGHWTDSCNDDQTF